MARPLTREQASENTAFLAALRRTGNARAAARAIGAKYGTMQDRRAKHPAFATRWEAALVSAHARLRDAGGRKGPEARGQVPSGAPDAALRTAGGEPVVVARRDGTLQLRAAQPGKLTRQCEQTFLLALSASANARMSAAAAGAAVAAFYRRRRSNPAFAREWRAALTTGYQRLEAALLAERDPGSHLDDAWQLNEPPEMPAMTVNQALQLMYLHQKAREGWDEPPHIKRRHGESREARSIRLSAMYEQRMERDREAFRVAEAARAARGEPRLLPVEVVGLPDLSQVTGWSRADPAKAPRDPGRALFGGWRIEDMEERGT